MNHSTRRTQPAPGLIYAHSEGEAVTRLTLNADLTVTVQQGVTVRTLEVAQCADVLPMWAERCFQAMRGELAGLTLGPVGERMARNWASRAGALGRSRGAAFHRALSRLGVPASEHYALCARALGRAVASLATLTEDEARRAWYHARRTCPAHHAA